MMFISIWYYCIYIGYRCGLGALACGSEMSARDWSRSMASTDPERERRNTMDTRRWFSCVMVEMMIDRVLLYIYRVSIFLEFSPGRSTRVGLDSGAPVPSCLN
jgi:hypothetical protein